MAGKKAAKKIAAKHAAKKSAAKKIAAKHAEHGGARDLRRAYEHMGRLEALGPLLSAETAEEIGMLLRFAQGSLTANDARSAADLLRAGEHVAFGSLAAQTRAVDVQERLLGEAQAECERLMDRAAEHWDHHSGDRGWPVDNIYERARSRSKDALKAGALRRALEFARAAEALAHVHGVPRGLAAGAVSRKLRA